MVITVENIPYDRSICPVEPSGLGQPRSHTIRCRITRCLFMEVHEDISFDMGVRTVKVDAVIWSAHKCIIDYLEHRAGPFSS